MSQIFDKDIARMKTAEAYPHLFKNDGTERARIREELRRARTEQKRMFLERKLAFLAENKRLRKEEKMKRAKEMLGKYNGGMTLERVGQEYGVTRERVRQLLVSTGEYVSRPKSKVRVIYSLVCKQCKGSFNTFFPEKIYCSTSCSRKGYVTKRWGEGHVAVRNRSIEEKRKYGRERMRLYYHNVLKKRPDFHERVRRYNDNWSKKRKLWQIKNREKLNARARERYRLMKKNG